MVDAARITAYAARGAVTTERAYWIIPLVAVAFGGAFVGRRLLGRLNENGVRYAVLVALFLVGVKMAWMNF